MHLRKPFPGSPKRVVDRISEVGEHAGELLARVHAQYERIHKDFRYGIRDSLISFQESVKSHLDQLVGPVPIEIKSFD